MSLFLGDFDLAKFCDFGDSCFIENDRIFENIQFDLASISGIVIHMFPDYIGTQYLINDLFNIILILFLISSPNYNEIRSLKDYIEENLLKIDHEYLLENFQQWPFENQSIYVNDNRNEILNLLDNRSSEIFHQIMRNYYENNVNLN